MRIRVAAFIGLSMLMQQPAGDRPAGNSRGTRSVVMAHHGAIATSQPLATAAGLGVLQAGGNALHEGGPGRRLGLGLRTPTYRRGGPPLTGGPRQKETERYG